MKQMVRVPLIALAIIAALSVLSMITSAVVWSRTSDRTKVVDNTIHSLRVLGDLRSDVARLMTATPSNRAERIGHVKRAVETFDPYVTDAERREWTHMLDVLGHVTSGPLDAPDRPARLARLEDSLDRLAEINSRTAWRAIGRIHEAHRAGLVFDIVEGSIVVLAAGALGVVLMRILRRQRAQIEQAHETLQHRNRELDAFAVRTAHDLRGPLAPILGYADLVAGGAPVEASRAAQKIRTAAGTMSAIIENLLALSAGAQLPAGQADPCSVVHGVVGELQGDLGGAHLTVDVDEGLVACAPNVLGQLLRNVIGNASKYRSPDRTLALVIRGKQVGDAFEISISDNGTGMTATDEARAFEEHYRGAGVGSRPGHGLGLPIVKRTIEAIGGRVELTSKLDVGTTVTLWIPIAAATT